MVVERNSNVGLASVLIVVLIVGLGAGLAVSGADIFNYNRSAAEARAQDQATQTAARKDQIDLAYYQVVRETEAEKLQMEVAAKRQELASKLRLAEISHYVWLGIGGLSLLIVSIGLSVFLILYGRSRFAVAELPKASTMGTWRNPEWRTEQIRIARDRAQYQENSSRVKAVPAYLKENGHH